MTYPYDGPADSAGRSGADSGAIGPPPSGSPYVDPASGAAPAGYPAPGPYGPAPTGSGYPSPPAGYPAVPGYQPPPGQPAGFPPVTGFPAAPDFGPTGPPGPGAPPPGSGRRPSRYNRRRFLWIRLGVFLVIVVVAIVIGVTTNSNDSGSNAPLSTTPVQPTAGDCLSVVGQGQKFALANCAGGEYRIVKISATEQGCGTINQDYDIYSPPSDGFDGWCLDINPQVGTCYDDQMLTIACDNANAQFKVTAIKTGATQASACGSTADANNTDVQQALNRVICFGPPS